MGIETQAEKEAMHWIGYNRIKAKDMGDGAIGDDTPLLTSGYKASPHKTFLPYNLPGLDIHKLWIIA